MLQMQENRKKEEEMQNLKKFEEKTLKYRCQGNSYLPNKSPTLGAS